MHCTQGGFDEVLLYWTIHFSLVTWCTCSRAMQSNPNKRRLSMVKPTWFIHVLFGALMVLWTRLTSAGSTLKLAWIFINSCFVLNHRSHDHKAKQWFWHQLSIHTRNDKTFTINQLLLLWLRFQCSCWQRQGHSQSVSQSVSVWGLGEASTGVRRQCDSIG